MDCGAVTSPVCGKSAVYQRTFAWIGCASLCAAGLWYSAAASSSVAEHHVRAQPVSQIAHVVSIRQSSALAAENLKTGMGREIVRRGEAGVEAVEVLQPTVQSNLPFVAAFAGFAAAIVICLKRLQQTTSGAATWTVAASLGEIMGIQRKSDEKRSPEKLGMDQVALAIKEEQARSKTMTPKEVVLELQRGNARFWSGMPERPEMNAMERRALIMAQAPMVCILSCADSRVPVEILFDQGLGRVFVVRVAGNILDPTAMGSIEFSVKYLGVKVVLVMGHEACGAVKGAMSMSNEDIDKQPAYLQTVLRSIRSNLDLEQLKKMRDTRAQDRQAIVTNTYSQVKAIQENKLIAERIGNGSLLVCGAFYEITSGMVDFFTLDKNGLVIDI